MYTFSGGAWSTLHAFIERGTKSRATLVRLFFSACNYFMAYCFNISVRVAQMGGKPNVKCNIEGKISSKHWQSGGKNAIKNAKQDSPFGYFFRIRWNVESNDNMEGKSYFPCYAHFDEGHGGNNFHPPIFFRLKNFWDYQFSMECLSLRRGWGIEIAGDRYFEWRV